MTGRGTPGKSVSFLRFRGGGGDHIFAHDFRSCRRRLSHRLSLERHKLLISRRAARS